MNIFSFCIYKYCKTISLASSAHPTNHILVTSLQTEYIKEFGYPVESHEITTEDGYILTYHRIPHGKTSNSSGGPPVLVQHGIMADSAVWVSVADSLGQHTLKNTIYYTHQCHFLSLIKHFNVYKQTYWQHCFSIFKLIK